jgi:uncharacterized membrane-anchored protein
MPRKSKLLILLEKWGNAFLILTMLFALVEAVCVFFIVDAKTTDILSLMFASWIFAGMFFLNQHRITNEKKQIELMKPKSKKVIKKGKKK